MAHPTPLPRTYLLGCRYFSMTRCAEDYRSILDNLGCLVPTLDEAEVVIVHASMGRAADMLNSMPGLADKYLVGYLVWEADQVPSPAVHLINYFDEIWTPSWYSARSLLAARSGVHWLPHVIRPSVAPSQEAVDELARLLGPPERCNLVQIGLHQDPRKAFDDAVDAFRCACYGRPGLTLVQKPIHAEDPAHKQKLQARREGNIIELTGNLSEDQLAALYARSHFVLSTHHGEGWGLTLSEGMAAGRPGIASNYSGNLAFMEHDTGIFIDGYEAQIRPGHRNRNFRANMRWHYPLGGHIEAAIARGYDLAGTEAYEAMSNKARKIAKVYDSRHIRPMMGALLARIGRSGGLQRPRHHREPYYVTPR